VGGTLSAADFAFGSASEDEAVAVAGGVVGISGADGVDGGGVLFAGASLSANDVPLDGVLAGAVLPG
jgi:hypothetical protein